MKQAAKATIFMIIVLLVGSVVFYKEKFLFIDFAHNIFRIVNEGRLQIEASRYGLFITQIFPLVGKWLHLPLPVLMILYSASFYLFYLFVALLLYFKFKDYKLLVLFGLFLTLMVSESNYYIQSEGIVWLMLAIGATFSIARAGRPVWLVSLVFAASFFIALWTHPLVAIAAIYLWFLYWHEGIDWHFSKPVSVIFSVVLLIMAYLKFHQSMNHGYDSGKIETVTTFKLEKLAHLTGAPHFKYFFHTCLTNYWLLSLVFISGMTALLFQKKIRVFLWTLAFVSGYLVLLFITYWDATSARFYLEIEYAPISIIASAPFVYYLLPRLQGRSPLYLVVLVFIVRAIYMFEARKPFEGRLKVMDQVLQKMRQKNYTKLLLTGLPKPLDSTLVSTWGMPVESTMLSQLEGEKIQRTFLFVTPDEANRFSSTGVDTLIGCWHKWGPTELDTNYFKIDRTSVYRVLSYDELMK